MKEKKIENFLEEYVPTDCREKARTELLNLL